MELKTPERARRRADDVLVLVKLVRDFRGGFRVDRLCGVRRGLEHVLMDVRALVRDERVCVNPT